MGLGAAIPVVDVGIASPRRKSRLDEIARSAQPCMFSLLTSAILHQGFLTSVQPEEQVKRPIIMPVGGIGPQIRSPGAPDASMRLTSFSEKRGRIMARRLGEHRRLRKFLAGSSA
jgi:hypothetical protein